MQVTVAINAPVKVPVDVAAAVVVQVEYPVTATVMVVAVVPHDPKEQGMHPNIPEVVPGAITDVDTVGASAPYAVNILTT